MRHVTPTDLDIIFQVADLPKAEVSQTRNIDQKEPTMDRSISGVAQMEASSESLLNS
jgi:hypothetical protein